MNGDRDLLLCRALVGLLAVGASACGAEDHPAADATTADAPTPLADASPPLADASPPDGAPPAPATPFALEGHVAGSAVPPDARAVMLWVFLGGDAVVKYGDGTSSGDRFSVRMADRPPAAAVRADGLAIGAMFLVPPTTEVPDGAIDAERLEILGASLHHLVVWKDPAGRGTAWSAPFPAGYSCGTCTPADLHTLAPVDCGETRIDAPPGDDNGCRP